MKSIELLSLAISHVLVAVDMKSNRKCNVKSYTVVDKNPVVTVQYIDDCTKSDVLLQFIHIPLNMN